MLVREAGGFVSDPDGNDPYPSGMVVCGNPTLQPKLREVVAEINVTDLQAEASDLTTARPGQGKVKLAAGQSLTVSFQLTAEQLAFIGQDTKAVLEAGWFDLWIAPSARCGEPAALNLTLA